MGKQEDFMDPSAGPGQHTPHPGGQPGLDLNTPGVPFEPMGLDPMSFEYGNQMGMPPLDSPNFNMDYNQQQLIQRQQPIAVLTQQQYALAAQQQQLGGAAASNNNNAFAPPPGVGAPYIVNAQDPYALGMLAGQDIARHAKILADAGLFGTANG